LPDRPLQKGMEFGSTPRTLVFHAGKKAGDQAESARSQLLIRYTKRVPLSVRQDRRHQRRGELFSQFAEGARNPSLFAAGRSARDASAIISRPFCNAWSSILPQKHGWDPIRPGKPSRRNPAQSAADPTEEGR